MADALLSTIFKRVLASKGRKLEFSIDPNSQIVDLIAIKESGCKVKIGSERSFVLKSAICYLVENHTRMTSRSAYLNENGECNLRKPLFNVKFTMPHIVKRFGHPFVLTSVPSADGVSVLKVTITFHYLNHRWAALEA